MERNNLKNKNLPPRVRARKQRSGRIYYYYDTGGRPRKEIPLGPDYIAAVQKWAELERERAPTGLSGLITFRKAAQRYVREVLPTKAARTQADNLKELEYLYEYFEDAPLSEIEPHHVRLYFTWRKEKALEYYAKNPNRKVPDNPGHVRANREIALFSHIFNFARETGLTSLPNPSAGVRKNRERSRDVYVEDDLYQKVWTEADIPTREAMDLAYLTGQRPGDAVRMDERDIRDGFLFVTQNKTDQPIRMQIIGELKILIERIRTRKRQYKVISTRLIVDEKGRALSQSAIHQRFTKARKAAGIDLESFQFRDLRAKAGTDTADTSGDIRNAQKQLGHKSVVMTETYIRARRGEKVNPTR